MGDRGKAGAGRAEKWTPADRCPWPRPFPADFAGCAAFQPVGFVVADSMNRRIGAQVTCRHLSAGAGRNGHSSRFYARCGLGAPADRVHWLATVRPERAAVMRALQEEFELFSRSHREALFAAKARLLAGRRSTELEAAIDRAMVDFLAAARGFVDERADRFADVGVPVAEVIHQLEEWANAWRRSQAIGPPQLGDMPAGSLLAERALVGRPVRDVDLRGSRHTAADHSDETDSTTPAAEPSLAEIARAELVLVAGMLQVARCAPPPTLVLSGEIDTSNAVALGGALTAELAAAPEVHVDLGSLLFCDVGGLRTIVSAARRAGEGRRVVVHRMPGHLRRAARVAGWTSVPEVVLEGDATA